MPNYTQYKDPTDTTAYPSPVIWADCPTLEMMHDPSVGVHHFDNFHTYVSSATTIINPSGYPVFEGDSTIDGVAGSSAGEVAVQSTTNNEGASLQVGGTKGAPFVIPSAGGGGKLWFEARVKVNSISDAVGQLYVGLAGEAAGTADFGVGEGDIGDFDVLGFLRHEEDGDQFDIITQKTGAGFDTIKADAVTLVADTYVKLGFVYDPNADSGKQITFYENGADLLTYVGKESGDATVYLGDTTNFPGGEEMSLLVSSHAESGADNTITMDWWRCAQLR